MRKLFVLAGIVAGLVVLGAPPGLTQSSDDLNNLRKEVETLKEGQKAIQSDLQEIKNLLRSRPTAAAPAAPAPAAEVTLSVDGAPVKGDKTAKVTLVDFTDYQ